ncbi:conserved membrane hypothetical protein [Candidatus Glomeribacter gigasporarum BEG34]|uniref:Transmembrane protein n=1 Tax=Candidatus Glomeribacter gigasporarum BEG34 TaxID=1070319 RepID=G2J9X5_9BURK|nr:conserved membrane hypothetical protein [Candidatus Glomeribacter gigasporarum BEG34]
MCLYPLLAALSVFQLTLPNSYENKIAAPAHLLPWAILLFSPLGLLPLIKGSFLPICVAVEILCAFMFLYKKDKKLAAISILSPSLSLAFFWLISGQSLYGLPDYFLNISHVISGYSEAMSSTGGFYSQIPYYIIAVSSILLVIGKSKDIPYISRAFLLLSFSLFLFISFKHGFVRHDAHATIAGSAIIISAILFAVTLRHKYLFIVFFLSVLSWAYIDKDFIGSSTKSFFENIKGTYMSAYDGIKARLFNKERLYENFNERLLEISQEGAIPRLNGTTDIYSYNQSYLLAAGNLWSPRPVIQSHGAYTPKLARLNELHLLSERAPNNIVFKVEPIDGRLASLEDGLSWPILIYNYIPFKLEKDFVYLRKKISRNVRPARTEILNQEHRLEETSRLPNTELPLFAEIDIHPTLLGRLLSFLYKPSALEISVKLNNGIKKNFRLVASMAKTGFLLSPLVENTTEFAYLFSNRNLLLDKNVQSVRVRSSDHTTLLWNSRYRLKLSRLELAHLDIHKLLKFNTIHPAIPAQTAQPASSVNCDGVIDWINGISPSPKGMRISSLLNVNGWLSISSKEGIVPEHIFVTLTDTFGKTLYIETRRTPRNDVKNHFNQPNMPDVGYEMVADISQLKGEYVLGLSRIYKNQIEHCQNLNVPAYIK